jgi:hypothetical protein
MSDDRIPALVPDLVPPLVRGPAAMTHLAYTGAGLAPLLAFASRPAETAEEAAALAFDCATAHLLAFRHEAAAALRRQALHAVPLLRVQNAGAQSARPLRVLALLAPGDLMANTPLDFLTRHLDVRLDLLFVQPGRALPDAVPDHDLAFFAAADADPTTLARLAPLFAAWPRPALNDPGRVLAIGREALAGTVAGVPDLHCPLLARRSRAALGAQVNGQTDAALPGAAFPLLLRPAGSHAGEGLVRVDDPDALAAALRAMESDEAILSAFADYRGADGFYRKYRIAFVEGAPFLCHMAVSEHWMVHYLNAGMAESAAKRAAEAQAMASFDSGFARRHARALAGIAERAGLDYFQIDCAEMPDGRLLLFEADVAGIVHTLDPPDLFPYKPPQMRRVIGAFGAMLTRRASRGVPARAA